jgi:hypothetical protein
MKKSADALLDHLLAVHTAVVSLDSLLSTLQQLRKRRLLTTTAWKTDVANAYDTITNLLEQSRRKILSHAKGSDFPQLISEDDVVRSFQISKKTLYRRRTSGELPYVRDKQGIIWYPVYDMIAYLIHQTEETKHEKPGRPRKF